MKKEEIVAKLEEKHQELLLLISTHPDENWEKGPIDKWSFGQHILHLLDSLKLLNKALIYPKFILKYKFGIANRGLRSYEEIGQRYEEKLAENLDRARQFNSKLNKPSLQQKNDITNKLLKEKERLQKLTLKCNDVDLDSLLIPHPLMGRMPVREIIMWTAHHTGHHTQILKENYL